MIVSRSKFTFIWRRLMFVFFLFLKLKANFSNDSSNAFGNILFFACCFHFHRTQILQWKHTWNYAQCVCNAPNYISPSEILHSIQWLYITAQTQTTTLLLKWHQYSAIGCNRFSTAFLTLKAFASRTLIFWSFFLVLNHFKALHWNASNCTWFQRLKYTDTYKTIIRFYDNFVRFITLFFWC